MKKIGIIGLGYVGLPLAIASSKKYSVIGYDNNLLRIKKLKKNIDSNEEFSKYELNKIKNIYYTNNIKELKDCYIKNVSPFYLYEDKENISSLQFKKHEFNVKKKENIQIELDEYER